MRQQKWWRRWFSRTAQIEVTVETHRTLVITHSEMAGQSEAIQTAQLIDLAPETGTSTGAIACASTEGQQADFNELTESRGN